MVNQASHGLIWNAKTPKNEQDDSDGEVFARKALHQLLQARRQRIRNPRIGSRLHGPLPCAQFTADRARIGRMASVMKHSLE